MFTSKGLGPYSGEGSLAEEIGRHMEQDEAGHDDRVIHNSKTTI